MKQIKINAAIRARQKMFSIWNPDVMHTKRMKLLIKTYGIVKADRMEDAILNENGDGSTISQTLWDRV